MAHTPAAPDERGDRRRYRAFISYSHGDKVFAARLHRQLESYRLPSRLVGKVTAVGATPRRLTPIFRDQDELPASNDLGADLTAALRASMFLIVVCSPSAARSPWVEEEIVQFKRAHGGDRVLAVIIDGTPHASAIPGRNEEECYPRALRYHIDENGQLTDTIVHPAAADARQGGDGPQASLLKLVAGLTGLKLDELVQRESQRRAQRLSVIAAASLSGMAVTGGLALYANQQRIVAEREAIAARTASDYLIGTFELINPDSENPKTITALAMLNRSARRAQTELSDQPGMQARVLATLGRAYTELGLFDEARGTVEAALPSIEKAGPSGAEAVLTLATLYARDGKVDQSRALIRRAEALLGTDQTKHGRLRGLTAMAQARLLFREADLDGGLARLEDALGYYRGAKDVTPRELAAVLHNRALMLADMGRFDDAEKSLREALIVTQRALGPSHVLTARAWQALARNSYQAGRLEAAERQIDSAAKIERVIVERDDPVLGDALLLQGQILVELGRYAEAEGALREAIAVLSKAYGGPHFSIGFAQAFLAIAQAEQGRTSAALRAIDAAKHNYDVAYGGVHPNHGELLVFRARVLAKAGRRSEARANCSAGVEILRSTLGAAEAFTKQTAAKCSALGPA
jgi:tetratricopeptide (TPR) repeat protein